MAIEFYDFEKKEELHKLFLNKLNELMSKDKVIEFLDEISKKEDNNVMNYDHDKLNKEIFPNFAENPEKDSAVNYKRRLTSEILDSYVFVSPSKKRNITPNKKNNVVEIKKNKDHTKEKLFSFNSNLNKLQDNISFDIKNQSNVFEEKKRNKMEKIKSCRGGNLKKKF